MTAALRAVWARLALTVHRHRPGRAWFAVVEPIELAATVEPEIRAYAAVPKHCGSCGWSRTTTSTHCGICEHRLVTAPAPAVTA